MSEATQEPVRISLEWTPNPNTIKLLTNRTILTKGAVNFTSVEAAAPSPLATRLMAVNGVIGVMLGTNFVTLTKNEEGDWIELHRQTVEVLNDHLAKGLPAYEGEIPATMVAGLLSDDAQKIQQIIEAEIRPAVAQDGGDIIFDRYENNVAYVHMRGSCSGCPSSTMTLRMGIESRLREVVPDLREVVSM